MQINKKQKELVKIYVFLLVLIGILMNWDSVSWLFNYRALSGLAYGFMYPYEDSVVLTSQAIVKTPANIVEYPYSPKDNSLEIPTLGLATPLRIGQSTYIPSLKNDLDKGVVVYPGSVQPSKSGQTIVLGHSAPPNWPKIKHDWVFSQLNNLKEGDSIFLYFNNRQYTYKVLNKDIVEKGQEVSSGALNGKNNILTLVSCWPPGKDYKRIAVYAELANSN